MTLRELIKIAHGYDSLGIYDVNGKLLCQESAEATIRDFLEYENYEVKSFIFGIFDKEARAINGEPYLAKRIRMCIYLTFNSDNQSCGG